MDSVVLAPERRTLLTETAHQYATRVDELGSYLSARGVDRDGATGHLLGLVYDPILEHERFAGWLSIPYVTPAGVVAFKFRCVRDHDCKAEGCQRYDAPAGQTMRLYNAGRLSEGGAVAAVCEGELKALITTSVLGVPAAGTTAGTWREHWSRAFADFDRVLVIADNDLKADGSNPGMKHARKVQKAISGAEIITPPPGVQIDEWVLQEGTEAVREAMGL